VLNRGGLAFVVHGDGRYRKPPYVAVGTFMSGGLDHYAG
jgi:hypothetical protein